MKGSIDQELRRARKPTLVEGIVGVGFEEEVLQSDHDGVQVEDGFPVLAEDVEADVAVEVEVRVVHFRDAFHLRRLVRVVVVDRKRKLERAALVHACGRRIVSGRAEGSRVDVSAPGTHPRPAGW